MGRPFSRRAHVVVAVLVGLAIGATTRVAPTAQDATLFTSPDYRQDRARWTDPAYYLHNTARELTDMQVDNRFGQKGSGVDAYDIKSPYQFRTSDEHYDA